MDNHSGSNGKKIVIVIAIAVVIVGLVGAWYGFMYIPEQEAKEKARQEEIAKKKAAAKKKKLQEQAAKKKAKYDDWLVKANGEFEQENWDAAMRSYSEASTLFPKEQYPQDQLVLVNEKLEEIASKLEGGTVETIPEATGRFYIIVSSSIDGDLAMDYAKQKAEEGESVKIIEPFGSNKFYRVSLDDFETRDEANAASGSFNSVDGDEIWILKY